MITIDIAERSIKVNSDFLETSHKEDMHKPVLQVVKDTERLRKV